MRNATILAGVLGVLLAAGVAQAVTVISSPPDIPGQYITTSYDPGTGAFSAHGFTTQLVANGVEYDPGNILHPLVSDVYNIDMLLDSGGALISGDVLIRGTVAELSAGPILLSGPVSQFQILDFDPIFYIVFDVTGGDLKPIFGPEVGITLSTNATPFDLAKVYHDGDPVFLDGLGVADAKPVVPEPLTVMGVLLGLSSLGGYLRKRQALSRS